MLIATLTSLFALTIGVTPTTPQPSIPHNETIYDFAGNWFVLKEGNGSYEIYTADNAFIEGSYMTNSPYYKREGKKFYLGPGNYFVSEGDSVLDIYANRVEPLRNFVGCSYEIAPRAQTRNGSSVADADRTYVDAGGFTVVNEADYFRRLKNFPNNWLGECGVIALAELLGYYDTFFHDDFIPNDLTYDARYYVPRPETKNAESSKYILDRTEKEPLVKTVTTSYRNADDYGFKDWTNMPGTTYAMRDYLFDKYMKTFLGIGIPGEGYPMLDGELKQTLEDYMKANCPHLLDFTEFRAGNLFYTHQKPKEYIAEGLPTLLVLQSYSYSNYEPGSRPLSSATDGKKGNKNHNVVAYGYKDDRFLVHMGWNPGSTSKAEIIVSDATIYGYFTIKFHGEHKHSSNVSMSNGNAVKYICGCGEVHRSHYSFAPNDWGFDARYFFENEGIKSNRVINNDLEIETKRLRCGYIENEYINLSPNRDGAGYAYLDLTFNKNVYRVETNLAFWSKGEGLFSTSGDYAYIKFLDADGNWHIWKDLLKGGISTDRTNPTQVTLGVSPGTKRILFEAYKAVPNTNRNKGRICIGSTTFVTR